MAISPGPGAAEAGAETGRLIGDCAWDPAPSGCIRLGVGPSSASFLKVDDQNIEFLVLKRKLIGVPAASLMRPLPLSTFRYRLRPTRLSSRSEHAR